MKGEFFEIVENASLGSEDSMMEVIGKFTPTIKKFSRELGYETSETDLIISLINIIKRIKLNTLKLDNDGVIISYIYNALKMKKIDLFRKHVKGIQDELEINLELIKGEDDRNYNDIENKLFVKEILQILTKNQRDVLVKKFIEGYSDIEIADNLHISRQAVNKMQNKALKILRIYLTDENGAKKYKM